MEINKYGLLSKELQAIISLIKENRKIEKVVLFGSRAKGNYSVGSDIDLSLMGKEIDLQDILDISIKLDSLNLPYKFDLIIYSRIKENALIEHINRIGIEL